MSPCPLEPGAGREPAHHLQPATLPRIHDLPVRDEGVERHGNEQRDIEQTGMPSKSRFGHTNDCERLRVHPDGLSDDGGVGAEALAPGRVRQNRHPRSARPDVFVGGEEAAEGGSGPEHGEVIGRDQHPHAQDRLTAGGDAGGETTVGGELLEAGSRGRRIAGRGSGGSPGFPVGMLSGTWGQLPLFQDETFCALEASPGPSWRCRPPSAGATPKSSG